MTIFSQIIAGEIPAYKILESDKFLAFLDINPLVKGHVLVVPKTEEDKLYNLPDEYLQEMLLFARPVCTALEKSMDCKRVALSVIGLEVPHAHLHLLPINQMEDTNFTRAKLAFTPEEMASVQQKIIAAL